MTRPKTPIRHFLLVFDHAKSELVELVDFGTERDRAVAAYAAKEQELETVDNVMEIVLIGSDSLETVKLTHANYFGRRVTSGYLADLEPADLEPA